MVDKKVLAIVTAVEISYLDPPVQEMLYEYMMENDICKAFQLYAVSDYLKDHETITKMELMGIFAIIFAAGVVILLMSVHILFGIDILKESLEKCRNE